MESPLYAVKQESKRIVIPEVLKMILLALTMYLGIYVNFMLLKKPMLLLHHLIAVVVLLILIIVQLKLSKVKASNIQYIFYQNRIEQMGDQPGAIFLGNVSMVYLKRDFMDKIFGTGTIYLEPGFQIRAVKHSEQISPYVQRLVELSRQSTTYA